MTAPATVPPDASGCPGFAPELSLYVDGELGETERSAVEAHLPDCAACREVVRYQLSLRRCLQRAVASSNPAEVRAPRGLRARITTALVAEDAASPPVRATRRWSWTRPIAAAGAGATALGLTAWLWFGQTTDDVVRDIVVRHSRRLPLEFKSDDPTTLEQWLADKVHFRVQVPKLHGRPYNLVGARLTHVKDKDAVYVVYGSPMRPDRRLAIVAYDPAGTGPVLPTDALRATDPDVFVANAAGYNVAVWKQNEVVYSLVSDGEDDVLDLVRAARGK